MIIARSYMTVKLFTDSSNSDASFPEISLDHLRVLHDVVRFSIGNEGPEIEYNDSIDDFHQLLQLMLHNDHSRTFTVESAKPAALVKPFDGLSH